MSNVYSLSVLDVNRSIFCYIPVRSLWVVYCPSLKAGVDLNLIEILGSLKRD